MINQSPQAHGKRQYEPLTVLAYVARYQQQNEGRSPSQRRIQRDLGISVPSVVHVILHRLERSGLLTIKIYERGHPAHLILTEAGQLAAQMWQEEQEGGTGTSAEEG